MAREYLEGLDRKLVHKLYLLRQEAKRNGRPATIVSIANSILSEALNDEKWDELRSRFSLPIPPDNQVKLFGGETCPS